MSRFAIIVAFVLLTFGAGAAEKEPWAPKNGFVPDAETAMRIAEAVWIPIYGKKQIEREKPFWAELKNDIWTVRGRPPVDKGGTAIAEIAKLDGRILRVVHTQ